MKKNSRINKSLIFIAIIDIALIIAIVYLMSFVQKILNDDVRINLTEIVTQNKDVINSKLTVEFNELELEAKQLSDRFSSIDKLTEENMLQTFTDYVKQHEDQSLVFAAKSGAALTSNGKQIDISGRNYFNLGLEGKSSISDRVISRDTGDDVFIICVPIIIKEKVVGTIQKQYTPEEMYNLCSVSLFSDQGSTFIINSQGYILINSEKSQYNKESDNYFRIIYLNDPKASKKLENDISQGLSGFMESTIDGENIFFAYTPIDKIQDWYLISSISKNAVSPNANIVVIVFYVVLFTMALLFSLSLFYFWNLKRKQHQKIEYIAFVDSVTGGDSFTKFTVNLKAMLQEHPNKQFYICSFDIDNFKYINRFYGFETGDKILKEIYISYSKKLLDNEYIARISGDHFIMLLTDVTNERLKTLINFNTLINDIKIYISAGIYTISDLSESINLMLDKADSAANTNKGKLFKKVEFYTDSFDQKNARDEQLKRSIEFALQNNEIIAFFQPKVDIRTKKLIGAEALARWRNSEGKLISPAEFIPVCEQTGLISLVDMTILENTLQFIRTQLDMGIECTPISVNFSRNHILDGNFVETVIEKLDKYKVPPELIELELTETVIFDNFQVINTFIKNLHDHGLKISMDDFGSGYSSLHMLKDIDIDVIKIDRAFLLNSINNEKQRVVFGTIVQMAKKLNIKVVVEGVETIENIQLMDEFNCYYAQGYYYSKPMDISDFEKVYVEGKVC